MGFPGGADGKESTCSVGDPGSIPGSGRSPGEGNGNPLQYSCLENPMDGEAWQATVHEVCKSRTRLSNFTFFLFLFFFFLFVVNSVILLSSSKLALWCYWECQRSNAYTDAGTKTDGLLKAPSKATEITYSINVYILLKLFVKNSKFWVLPLSLYTDWMLLSSVDFEATESWFSSPSILSHSCFLVWFMVQHLASQHG